MFNLYHFEWFLFDISFIWHWIGDKTKGKHSCVYKFNSFILCPLKSIFVLIVGGCDTGEGSLMAWNIVVTWASQIAWLRIGHLNLKRPLIGRSRQVSGPWWQCLESNLHRLAGLYWNYVKTKIMGSHPLTSAHCIWSNTDILATSDEEGMYWIIESSNVLRICYTI